MRDNGPLITNYVAYESRDGSLAEGYQDAPPAGFLPSGLTGAMSNLSDMPSASTNTLYASIPLNYEPLTAVNAGFSKAVASPEYPIFASSTLAHAAGQCTYRLRYENAQSMQSKDIVLYDVLETRYDGNPYRQGTLTSVDTSTALAKGIDAKVYYAITEVDPTDPAQQLGGSAGAWHLLEDSTDLDLIKAVAIDLRTKTDGTPCIVAPGEILMANLVMTAPVDADGSLVAGGILAYNASYMANRKAPLGSSAFDPDLAVERGNTVTVQLVDTGLDLHKVSLPASGTAVAPAPLQTGDSLSYLISASNTNTAQALYHIQVEDQLPAGLTLDTGLIKVRFDDNPATDQPLTGHPRAQLLSYEAGRLAFRISSLAGGEKITFLVPTTVDSIAGLADQRDYVNQAQVTRLGGRAFLMDSEITWHRLTAASFAPQAAKSLIGRDIREGDDFSFRLSGSQGEPLQTVAITPPSGAVALDALHFDRAGTYIYAIEELPGLIDSVSYDALGLHLGEAAALQHLDRFGARYHGRGGQRADPAQHRVCVRL